MKKKGRKRLPKVGSKPEREYALKESRRDVAGNFGVRSKGITYWVAIVLIGALVIAGITSFIFL